MKGADNIRGRFGVKMLRYWFRRAAYRVAELESGRDRWSGKAL